MVTSTATIITSVSAEGLQIERDHGALSVSWSEIETITVGTAPDGDARVLVMTIEHAEEQVLFTYEHQSIWHRLIEVLPLGLPGIVPFEMWSTVLRRGSGEPFTIYERIPDDDLE